jgi:hypothetical protein
MSTSSVSPGLSNLLESLNASLGSSVLASPKVQTALQNAPAADIIKLSAAATELQGLDAILGNSSDPSSSSSDSLLSSLYSSDPSSPSSTPSTDSLVALERALSQATPGESSSAVSAALANYQQSSQASLTQSLLGSSSSTSVFG